MIDVSQVFEYPSAKLYLLKQLPITKITQISTLKLTLNRGRLFGGRRLIGGALILPHNDFGGRARGELQELKQFSRVKQFLHYGF